MATTPHRPNPLHGKLPAEPAKENHDKEVEMPGRPPASNMKPSEDKNEPFVLDSTREEMEGGRKALDNHDERLKAEMEVGKRVIDRLAQAATQKE